MCVCVCVCVCVLCVCVCVRVYGFENVLLCDCYEIVVYRWTSGSKKQTNEKVVFFLKIHSEI